MIIGVYSSKGGVGKTTLAVNLAWASAAISKRNTLLWDLDAQGAASYIVGQEPLGGTVRKRIVDNDDLTSLIRPTSYDRLDVLGADRSLRHLDRDFHELGKPRRLAKVAEALGATYDRVIIDCPPGLTDTSDQLLRASDVIVVPVIPAPLSRRALDAIVEYMGRKERTKVVLAPVFSMVDRRRLAHRRELEEHPAWPIIPMASAYERVSLECAPIGALLPSSAPPVEAVADLWRRLEKALVSRR
jgi:cellulose biosynthesis protein BcsQ